jgi:HSP20 family protein
VHVSLPGAKKEDLSIDYDAGESVLRLAGVVYRPGITEDLHQGLVMEERAREVGVFEREVRLGTRAAPAAVVVEEISAKLEDGVLNVTVPKVQEPEVSQEKKVVVVEEEVNEKDAMHLDESDSETATPDEGSEGSDAEGEAREYVKVSVQ